MDTETPLAPRQHQYDVTIYIVLDQFGGAFGRAYRETDESYADEHTTIDRISDGKYSRPVRVVAFNIHEGWSRDVTEEIALKLLDLSGEGRMLCATAREFVERVTGKLPHRQSSPLIMLVVNTLSWLPLNSRLAWRASFQVN